MRERIALALAFVAACAAPSPAAAGPDPEPDASRFDIAYPGSFRVSSRARDRVVARIAFDNYGGSPSAGLDVCVRLPAGFHDARVLGNRRRVRVTQAGAKVCWFAGVIQPDDEVRATVRATAPRRPGRYDTTVRLIAVEDAREEGEFLERTGTVRVR